MFPVIVPPDKDKYLEDNDISFSYKTGTSIIPLLEQIAVGTFFIMIFPPYVAEGAVVVIVVLA